MDPRTLKRAFDVAFALVVGVAAAPVLLVAMLVVRVASPGSSPVFRQERVGLHGRPFTMYKLRTMTDERDAEGRLLPDGLRLRAWGRVIRRLSLDELPQVANILRGDMSWIGPRPLLPEEMRVMTPGEQAERQSVPPGITGWEAVNEERSSDRRTMAEFDLEYVRGWSPALDARIFVLTVGKLLRADRSDEAHRAPKL